MRRIEIHLRLCLVVSALVLASCTGAIADGGGGDPGPAAPASARPSAGKGSSETGGGGGEPPGTRPAPSAACSSPSARGMSREGVRRLSREELRLTLTDLLPVSVQLNGDIDLIPDIRLNEDATAFTPFHTEGQVSQWLNVVDQVGVLVASDKKHWSSVSADPCLVASPVTATCAQTVLRGFLRRALRRPVTDDEVNAFAMGSLAGKDAAAALPGLIMRVLTAPDFMFHIEYGGVPSGGRTRLTSHEVANRISYATTGSGPDATLVEAADTNQLQTLAQVEGQVRRLLSTPRGQIMVKNFFGSWADTVALSVPDAKLYSKWAKLSADPGSAVGDMAKDIMDFVGNVVVKEKGTFRDLLTKRTSYTASPVLQSVYGAQAPAMPGGGYETPDHAGLTFRAGFLVGAGLNTSPIVRGARYMKRVLCMTTPEPDPSLIARRDDVNVDPLTTPNYQRVTMMTAGPDCKVCHAMLNPIGYLMEGYDPVGRKRTQESYIELDKSGNPLVKATHMLPGAIDLTLPDVLPSKLEGASQLAEAVAASDAAKRCLGASLVEQPLRRKSTDGDKCAVAETTAALGGTGTVMDALVRAVANEDIFYRGA